MATAHTQAYEHYPSTDTPNTSATIPTDSNSTPEGQGSPPGPLRGKGLEALGIIAAVLSALGLLTTIFGIHLTPSKAAIITGTVAMTLACLL